MKLYISRLDNLRMIRVQVVIQCLLHWITQITYILRIKYNRYLRLSGIKAKKDIKSKCGCHGGGGGVAGAGYDADVK